MQLSYSFSGLLQQTQQVHSYSAPGLQQPHLLHFKSSPLHFHL